MEQQEDGSAVAGPAENPFWKHSVAAYGLPGVKEACLALQDEAGLDVNLLLFCCWSATAGKGRLARAEIQSAMAVVAVWRVQVLQPLRRVRRRLSKTGPEDERQLRTDLLKVELAAERIEQVRLYDRLPQEAASPGRPVDDRREDARYNCDIYFDELGVKLPEDLEPALNTVIDAATRD